MSRRKVLGAMQELLSQQHDGDRVARLPPELLDVYQAFEARISLDDLLDEFAVAIHGARSGPPTEMDFKRASVKLWHDIRRIRQILQQS